MWNPYKKFLTQRINELLFETLKYTSSELLHDMSPEHRKQLGRAKTPEERQAVFHAAAEDRGGIWGGAPKVKKSKPTTEKTTPKKEAKFQGEKGQKHHHEAILHLAHTAATHNISNAIQTVQNITGQPTVLQTPHHISVGTNSDGGPEMFPKINGRRSSFHIEAKPENEPPKSRVAYSIKGFHSSVNNTFETGSDSNNFVKNEDAVVTTHVWHGGVWSTKRHNIEFGQGDRKDFLRVDQTTAKSKTRSAQKSEERQQKKLALDKIERSFSTDRHLSSHTVEQYSDKEWHVKNSKGEIVSTWASQKEAESNKPIQVRMTWGEVKKILGDGDDGWKGVVGHETHIVHYDEDKKTYRTIQFKDLHDSTPITFEKLWRKERKTTSGATRSASLDTKLRFSLNPKDQDYVFHHNAVPERSGQDLLDHFAHLHRREFDSPITEWVMATVLNRLI